MSHASFDQRLSRLTDRHRRLSLGVTYRVRPDGLIVAAPKRRLLPRFPLRPLLAVLATAFALKAVLFVTMGEATYEARRALLAEGSAVEAAAAWAMQPDPAVRALEALVGDLRRP
jgi:hypothetical protein